MSLARLNHDIKAYHAHLYYNDEKGVERAKEIAQMASELFDIQVGRFHLKPVGPHPVWSCQLSFSSENYAVVIPWLMFNRQSLDVFVHPVTGNDYLDHTQAVSWLGKSYVLDTSIFTSL